ncbi:hypothetical protein C1N53_05280 [Pontibacter sp. SGAir0037]|nr:hypothetical protein C1N53_05280 [Pontibacter sp. SGAir0037]
MANRGCRASGTENKKLPARLQSGKRFLPLHPLRTAGSEVRARGCDAEGQAKKRKKYFSLLLAVLEKVLTFALP